MSDRVTLGGIALAALGVGGIFGYLYAKKSSCCGSGALAATAKSLRDDSGEFQKEKLDAFLGTIFQLTSTYCVETSQRDTKIVDWMTPENMQVAQPWKVGEDAASLQEIVEMIEFVLDKSVRTGHPRFFNQLFAGQDIISVVGELITALVNTSMYTFEVAPVFTTMERNLLEQLMEQVGFDPNEGEGYFSPGGSISNLYALLAARHWKVDTRQTGLQGQPKKLALFTSDQSHYSLKKACMTLGLGLDALFTVATDEMGRMVPSALKDSIAKARSDGFDPFFVNATAGTTVFGAFDPFNEIADIAKENSLWMHVDGAWGASASLSPKYKYLVDGISRADSLTWNPHKLLGVNLQASAILFKKEGTLEKCNSLKAKYLFQKDKFYDVKYDKGDNLIQCGRHVDVLKVWLSFKAHGLSGLSNIVENACSNAKYLAELVHSTEGFELILEPLYANICFWYVPKCLRGDSSLRERNLHQVAPYIKKRMTETGCMMIGFQPNGSLPNFFRMIVVAPHVNKSDMEAIIATITRFGDEFDEKVGTEITLE